MRSLASVSFVLVLAACGGDDEKRPSLVDAPPVDAVVVDAPAVDAGIDAAMTVDAALDASPLDINGCTPATATDLSGMATPTVTFGGAGGLAYTPRCSKINAGQAVTFSGMFTAHPLRGGTVVGGVPTLDPSSPITATDTGTSATIAFPTAGVYGFYCNLHGSGGMNGAIYVQ